MSPREMIAVYYDDQTKHTNKQLFKMQFLLQLVVRIFTIGRLSAIII